MYIKNRDNLLLEPNLRTKKYILELLEYALNFANPRESVEQAIKFSDMKIELPKGRTIKLHKDSKIFVVGFGKASQQMAQAIEKIFENLIVNGVVITPYTARNDVLKKIKVINAGHPLPDENSIVGCKEIINVLSKTKEKDVVFVLISGGGSALFECPKPPITLEDLQVLTKQLLKCGADIYEINTIRKHISKVKGGQLLQYIKGHTVSLIVSDVVGDDFSVIASGPTFPDNTTYKDAYTILEKYELWNQIPSRIRDVISMGINGDLAETPKENDPIFDKVTNVLISSNKLVIKKLEEKINNDKKFNAFVLTTRLVGEAREIGKLLANMAMNIIEEGIPVKPPVIILLGGETTVTVKGKGIGGRNQELVLSALNTIKNRTAKVIFVSIGTDGIDGNSDAAGAMADAGTYTRAMLKGIEIEEYLKNNNSNEFFKKVGNSLIYTGYTGTNVNDIAFLVVEE